MLFQDARDYQILFPLSVPVSRYLYQRLDGAIASDAGGDARLSLDSVALIITGNW